MKDNKKYYNEATTWALDAQRARDRSVRIAWICAGIAVAVALLEAVALAMLAPLKSVQTVAMLVDRQTGYVQAIDPSKPRSLVADEALTNAYLAQYVVAREGFDRATIVSDYEKVALWSTGRARTAYLASMPSTNPNSPLRRLPPGAIVQTTVKSVSPLNPGMALVRFDTMTVSQDGQGSGRQPWVAVIRFRYVDGAMRLEDRFRNPLGFQVTNYRRDQEAAPSPAETSATDQGIRPINDRGVIPPAIRSYEAPAPLRLSPERGQARRMSADPATTVIRRVPINQIPLGSPLSAGRENVVRTAAGPL